MRRPLLILTLGCAVAAAALPAAADRWSSRADAVAAREDAVAQHRRERRKIHEEFDRKATELAGKPFATRGERIDAWRKLEEERRVKIADVDEDFEARLADYRKRRGE